MSGFGKPSAALNAAVADLVPDGWDCDVSWCFIGEDGEFSHEDTGQKYYRVRLNTPKTGGSGPFHRRYMTLIVDPEAEDQLEVAVREIRAGIIEMRSELEALLAGEVHE